MKRLVVSIDRQGRRVTMKKIIALLTVLSSVFFSVSAIAQNKPFACQSDAVGGLRWETREWKVSSFQAERFILVQTSDGLTKESVGKALKNMPASQIECRNAYQGRISCSDLLGDSLFFDPTTLKGGISLMFGATQSDNDSNKDTLTLVAFSCTPF